MEPISSDVRPVGAVLPTYTLWLGAPYDIDPDDPPNETTFVAVVADVAAPVSVPVSVPDTVRFTAVAVPVNAGDALGARIPKTEFAPMSPEVVGIDPLL